MKRNYPVKNNKLKKSVKAFNWRLLGILAGTSLISCILYFYLAGTSLWKPAMIAYVSLLCAAIIAYVIVNRGFTDRDVTFEMLPDTMTEKEKYDYISAAAKRYRDSRWMLIVIIALGLPVMLDLFKLYVVDVLFPDGLF